MENNPEDFEVSNRPQFLNHVAGDCGAVGCNGSRRSDGGRGLSFLNALQDAIKKPDTNMLTVMLFPGPGKESSMCLTIDNNETVGDVIDQMAPEYFKLSHGMFRRAKAEDLAALQRELCMYSEHQVIGRDVKVVAVLRHHKRVVISAMTSAELLAETGPFGSGHSIRSFLRSERSEGDDDQVEGFDD